MSFHRVNPYLWIVKDGFGCEEASAVEVFGSHLV